RRRTGAARDLSGREVRAPVGKLRLFPRADWQGVRLCARLVGRLVIASELCPSVGNVGPLSAVGIAGGDGRLIRVVVMMSAAELASRGPREAHPNGAQSRARPSIKHFGETRIGHKCRHLVL